jgi:hypothetical protein
MSPICDCGVRRMLLIACRSTKPLLIYLADGITVDPTDHGGEQVLDGNNIAPGR